jgi:hypothetical protein
LLQLDHVVIGVADLTSASAELSEVLGRGPSWHGRHPSYGTANVLFRLGSAYLELLARDPSSTVESGWTEGLATHLAGGGGLYAVALGASDIRAAAATLRARGLPLDAPREGEGQDLRTGATRRWTNAQIPVDSTRGTRVFVIEHRSPPAALPEAPRGESAPDPVVGIDSVSVDTGDLAGARRMWREVFGLSEREAPRGFDYSLGNASLQLQGLDSAGGPEDRWSSVALRVPVPRAGIEFRGTRISFTAASL